MNDKYLDAIVNLNELEKKTSFKRYPPSHALKECVELYWSVSWNLDDGQFIQQKILPNPHVNIVTYSDGVYIEGVIKSYFSYELSGSGHILGVKFRVGGLRTLLDRDMKDFTNQKIDITEILPGPWHKLRGIDDIDARIALIEEILMGYKKTEFDCQAEDIVDFIKDNKSIYKVDDLCKHYHISLRQLQRLFKTYVGVNPKWVIRMTRLQELKLRIENGDPCNWSDLSFDLGYSDQSHMINDFKSILGISPDHFLDTY